MKRTLLKWLTVLFSVITLCWLGVACDGRDQDIGGLTFKTFSVYDTVASGTVSNDTDSFSFNEEITSKEGTSFLVSADKFGEKMYTAKTVPLEVGDNVFYILEALNGDVKNTYTVTIYRKAVYTVRFDTQGGTEISSQRVEEYGCATRPKKTPTREGYTFVDWDFDFTKSIKQNTVIKAEWTANPYTLTVVYGNGQPNEQKTVLCGEEIELDAPTQGKDGYVFTGWDVYVMPAEDTTVTAQWKPMFTLDGGTITDFNAYGTNLTELTIPSQLDGVTITSIGDSAFYNCSSLTSIEIPNSVTSIDDYAFYNCSGLISVVIGDGVTSIGSSAFNSCDNLTSVVIGDSVESIDYRAFYDCYGLTSVYYKGTASEWEMLAEYISYSNTYLTSATRYYYVESEADVPTDGGNYWRYVDGVPTAW